MASEPRKTLVTPEGRASYVNILTPRKNDLSGEDEYSMVLIFPSGADLKPLRALAEATARAKWPNGLPAGLKNPVRKSDDLTEKKEGYDSGTHFITVKCSASRGRPGIVDADRNEVLDSQRVYSGMYARAEVTCYAFDKKGNKGVAFGLNHVQILRDGPPLGSRTRVEDAFKPAAGTSDGSASSLFDS